MNENELKTLVERIAVTIEEYMELVALKKDFMTQKTYQTKKEKYAESLGTAVGKLIEVRLQSTAAMAEAREFAELEEEVKDLGFHLIQFIDKRIQELPKR